MTEAELRTTMAKAILGIIGSGYVNDYYYQLGEDFVQIAKAYKGDEDCEGWIE